MVAGAPGSGKSVLALNISLGLSSLGLNREGGSTLYLAMDSAPSVFARSAALALSESIASVYGALRDKETKRFLIEDLSGQHPNFFINPGQLQITNATENGGWNGIEQRIVALTEVLGKAPELVVIDNLIDLDVPGHVHTETGFYAAALNPLKQIAIKHNTCIMALHHVTRRGGTQGTDPLGLGTRPLKMTDLLYSGEREAEHVLGVHHAADKRTMNVQILKQRDGDADPEGGLAVPLMWHAPLGRLDGR